MAGNILFPFTDSEIDELGVTETEVRKNRGFDGKTTKARVKSANALYVGKPTVTLQEYSALVYNWLLINKNAFAVLDFYEDDSNMPFEYPMEEVEKDERIEKLLQQRLMKLCLTEKQFRYTNFASILMANRFGWVTSRTSVADKPEPAPDTNNNDDVQFKFGN